ERAQQAGSNNRILPALYVLILTLGERPMINRAIGTLGLFALICMLSFSMWYVNRPTASMTREIHSARSQLIANPGDGVRAEQRAADREERIARVLERFPEADANEDGVLSQEEFRAF